MKTFLKILPAVAALAAAAFALPGCNKAGEVDCTYVVKTYFQDEEKGPVEIAPGAIGYVFWADANAWQPAGYDDAAAGVITSSTGGTMNYALAGIPGDEGTLSFAGIAQKGFMLVVCFPDTRSYAVRSAWIEAGIAAVDVSVTFRTWKEEYPFTDSKWTVWNQDPPVTADCDYTVPVLVQPTEGADYVKAPDAVGYAFWADTTSWKVASLDDALAGKITSGGSTRTADVTGVYTPGAGSMSFEGITRRRALLLVCSQTQRMWAVTQVETPYGQAQGTYMPALFCTWAVPDRVPYYVFDQSAGQDWKVTYQPVPAPDPQPEPEP